MRHIITLILVTSSLAGFSQQSKWQLSLQLQPEFTIHKSRYPVVAVENGTKSTFNIGFNTAIQYRLSDKLFADAGLGYISRQLNTMVGVDQAALPRPYFDSSKVFYTANSVVLRTLQIPVGIGYNFLKTGKTAFFARAVYVTNFLLNAKYDVSNYPSFGKNYWQGHSINLGLGFDRALNKKIILTNSLTYSVLNTVKRDKYLLGKGDERARLEHKYLQLSSGVKIKL